MNVKYLSYDMSKTFIAMDKTHFPNTKIVVEMHHFIRKVYWALENVRKNVKKHVKDS